MQVIDVCNVNCDGYIQCEFKIFTICSDIGMSVFKMIVIKKHEKRTFIVTGRDDWVV